MRILFHAGTFLLGSAAVYAVVVACSGGGAGGAPIGNADAQSCPDCTGLVRTLSPETDPAQAVGGTGVADSLDADIAVAQGPFYLTDVVADTDLKIGTVQAGQPCAGFEAFEELGNTQYGYAEAIHGGRILINANETLCIGYFGGGTSVTFRWSGYRPY